MPPSEIILPLAFTDDDLSTQSALIESAEERLRSLKIQMLATRIAGVFQSNPELETLMFFLNEDRSGQTSVDYSCNLGASWSIKGRDPGVSGAMGRLKELIELGIHPDAWRAFHRVRLERPALGSIAQAILAARLGAEAFAEWQASELASAAHPAPPLSRAPLSL